VRDDVAMHFRHCFRFRARRFVFAFAIAIAISAAAVAGGSTDDGARALSPFFRVSTAIDPRVDALPLKDTHVEVTIAGMIADVTVLQTYLNAGDVPIDATYVFPGSTRAAVHGLTMKIGERLVHALIKERGEAKRTFAKAKADGKTASLLEQQRPNVFQMNLANILPGDVVQVELRYTELLRADDGDYEFVFPTVVGPRYSHKTAAAETNTASNATSLSDAWVETEHLRQTEKPSATFALNVRLVAGVPLREVTCATHPVVIDRPGENEARLAFDPASDASAQANRDFILHYRLAGDAVHAGLLASTNAAGENFFLAMVQPPARVETVAIPPRDYIFVIDVSGSMNGFPLEIAKQLLHGLIGNLRETDTFNIVLFAGASSVLAPSPIAATPDNLAAAITMIDYQRSGGGTELLPALKTAFALPGAAGAAHTIVVLTDGYVDIEPEAFDLVRNHPGHANLFAFGIGTSVNRHLIEGLARAGQGEPFVVTSPADATATAERFRRYIATPALVGLRASFDNFDAYDVTPAALPDVFAERPVVFFGKWRGPANGSIRLEGVTGDENFFASLDMSHATDLGDSRVLELLWARARISELDDKDLGSRDKDLVASITKLGLAHGLLTKYTSFVAVDEVVHAATPDGRAATVSVKQPLPLPEGVSETAVGTAVPTAPEPATVALVAIALCALAWAFWRTRARHATATEAE
jgi:Ca-activated chloride channel family protein